MNTNFEMTPPTESEFNYNVPNINTDDEIQSMESKFKEFEFQQIGLTNDTKKCIDFWKIIREHPISPAPPSFTLTNDYVQTRKDKQSAQQEPAKECECYVWCKALHELQKRNMDQVALAIISKPKQLDKSCKYCTNIKNIKPKQDMPEDLTILNKFKELDKTGSKWLDLSKSTQTSFLDNTYIRGHPIVDKVAAFVSVYDPTVTSSSDEM